MNIWEIIEYLEDKKWELVEKFDEVEGNYTDDLTDEEAEQSEIEMKSLSEEIDELNEQIKVAKEIANKS